LSGIFVGIEGVLSKSPLLFFLELSTLGISILLMIA
jgi:hypothetical protein